MLFRQRELVDIVVKELEDTAPGPSARSVPATSARRGPAGARPLRHAPGGCCAEEQPRPCVLACDRHGPSRRREWRRKGEKEEAHGRHGRPSPRISHGGLDQAQWSVPCWPSHRLVLSLVDITYKGRWSAQNSRQKGSSFPLACRDENGHADVMEGSAR